MLQLRTNTLVLLPTAFLLFAIMVKLPAQQKKKSDALADDKQTLSDAYAAMVQFLSSGDVKVRNGGFGRDPWTAMEDRQLAVVPEPSKCRLSWDPYEAMSSNENPNPELQDSKNTREVLLLNHIDLKSISKIAAADRFGGPPTTTIAQGFVIALTFTEPLPNFNASDATANPNNRQNFAQGDLIYLSSSSDADRFIKAMTYAAKRCGARETAF